MTKKALCLAGALLLGIAGCGHIPTHMPPPPGTRTKHDCSPPVCTIDVLVVKVGTDCIARVDVDAYVKDPLHIHWVLKHHDYSFPPHTAPNPGIFLKDPPDGEFAPENGNRHLFILKDKHTPRPAGSPPVRYNYGVRIYDEVNGRMCRELDPVIVNEF